MIHLHKTPFFSIKLKITRLRSMKSNLDSGELRMPQRHNMRMSAYVFGSLLRVLNVVRNSYVTGWVGEACCLCYQLRVDLTSTVKFISTKLVIFPSRLHFQNITFYLMVLIPTDNKHGGPSFFMFFNVRLLIRLRTCATREMSMVGQVAFSERFSKKLKRKK